MEHTHYSCDGQTSLPRICRTVHPPIAYFAKAHPQVFGIRGCLSGEGHTGEGHVRSPLNTSEVCGPYGGTRPGPIPAFHALFWPAVATSEKRELRSGFPNSWSAQARPPTTDKLAKLPDSQLPDRSTSRQQGRTDAMGSPPQALLNHLLIFLVFQGHPQRSKNLRSAPRAGTGRSRFWTQPPHTCCGNSIVSPTWRTLGRILALNN
jgi:hypothetical protein